MGRLISIALCLIVFLISCRKENAPAWTDLKGTEVSIPDSSIALMIFVPDCPWARRYATEFQKLSADTAMSGVSFAAVISGNHYSDDEIHQFIEATDFHIPLFLDQNGRTTRYLKAEISPQFFLLDARRKVLYDGAFDNRLKDLGQHGLQADSFYFRDAILAMLTGKKINPSKTKATGCYLETDF